jgi:hypothetical protein
MFLFMLRYTIDHLEYVYINRAMNGKLICISYRRTKGVMNCTDDILFPLVAHLLDGPLFFPGHSSSYPLHFHSFLIPYRPFSAHLRYKIYYKQHLVCL